MRFGWCMDNHHENCRQVYRQHWSDDEVRRCDCECHKGKELPDPPPSKESLRMPVNPNPRRRKG